MAQFTEDFLATPKGMDLYEQGVALYERIENENSHTAKVNGITMGYLDFGPIDGVPLIWAHGSGSTRYELLNVQAALVEAGYRVIGIDYRGHGKTQLEVTDYNMSLYHIADDIAALMDHLKITKAVVGGLSKGGWVAAAFYDTYPKRVLGLLLEDGGSFSHLRFKEEVQLGVIQPGPSPYPGEAAEKLHHPSARFKSQLEGVKALWAAYSPALSIFRKENLTAEYFAGALSLFRQEEGLWVHHSDPYRIMFSKEQVGSIESIENINMGATLFSRLPLMQQSQELMLPFVVFRNLSVPMHIIDPESPTDWMPVRHQNEELQKLHPDLIVHEVYDYEHSPHEAHIERPERFIESAKALLARVKNHAY